MSRHSARCIHFLKVKLWVAILIALVVSAEIGVALAWALKYYGVT